MPPQEEKTTSHEELVLLRKLAKTRRSHSYAQFLKRLLRAPAGKTPEKSQPIAAE
jgi:hypothetical protein